MTDGAPEPVPEPVRAASDLGGPGASAASVSAAIPPKCLTRTRQYRDGRVVDQGFPAEKIGELLAAEGSSTFWLDLDDPDEDDLQILVEEFGLHPLAVEDAVHDRQRPKVDRYPTHLFLTVYAVQVEGGDDPRLRSAEISVFVTPRALITVRKSEFDVDTLVGRWDLEPAIADGHTVSYLLYGLLDAVADGHYEALEVLEDRAEDLEDALFDPKSDLDVRRHGFELRRALGQLRRIVAPMPDLVARLMRPDLQLAVDGLEPYYRDVGDHVQRSAEAVDAIRDMVAGVLQAELNEQGNALNEITKKLASWAAIIAVPTAVTGFFGQNVPYPGFGTHSGFVGSVAVMVVLALGVYWLLRRQGWL
jgi:magnesium transporter